VFNTDFNVYFYSPEKDRCDLCEEMNMKEDEEDDEDEKGSLMTNKAERDMCKGWKR
jgi:hypothetical protein